MVIWKCSLLQTTHRQTNVQFQDLLALYIWTLMGIVCWKSHLRRGHSAQTSQLGRQPGYFHGASPADEVGGCKYLIWCNFALFSFSVYYYLHLCIDYFPFLSLLGFYNNKIFFPFQKWHTAVVNLLCRTVYFLSFYIPVFPLIHSDYISIYLNLNVYSAT